MFLAFHSRINPGRLYAQDPLFTLGFFDFLGSQESAGFGRHLDNP